MSTSVKKYILLKALPGLEEGSVFTYDPGLNLFVCKTDTVTYSYFPTEIEKADDWFRVVMGDEPKFEVFDCYFAVVVDENGYRIEKLEWLDKLVDRINLANDNAFFEEEAAMIRLKESKARLELIELIRKLNDGWKPNWTDTCEAKFCIYYEHVSGEFYSATQHVGQYGDRFYMKDDFLEVILKQLGEEALKLALGIK
jgi:hypothetical protein